MKIAVLAPITWRTPPVNYGPWEILCGLVQDENYFKEKIVPYLNDT
jgi:hypothetical protein